MDASDVVVAFVPGAPLGITRFRTCVGASPVMLADAAPSDTVPIESVFGNPLAPVAPLNELEYVKSPVDPVLVPSVYPLQLNSMFLPFVPFAPRGIVKLNFAAAEVPSLDTAASVPAAPVVTVPTVIVAAAPVTPSAPLTLISVMKVHVLLLYRYNLP